MAEKQFIAVDLGSSSGSIQLGSFNGNRLQIEECHEFVNTPVRYASSWHWNVHSLWNNLLEGLQKACAQGTPTALGVATWGVDFGLLDRTGELLGGLRTHRDPRTDGAYDWVFERVSPEALYAQTGILFLNINTLPQLATDLRDRPELFDAADALLMLPDLFNYFLTGEQVNERTSACTTQLLDVRKQVFAHGLMESLGLPPRLTRPLIDPGSQIGPLHRSLRQRLELPDLTVLATASHDTAAAVAAAPVASGQPLAFISAGTWSLLGVEREAPDLSPASQQGNFSNETGVDRKILYQKILCGLWLVQECRRSFAREGEFLDFPELMTRAEQGQPATFWFDPDHPDFLNPDDMPTAIRSHLQQRGRPVPESQADLLRGVYESLALNHAFTLQHIGSSLGETYETLHMVSGGSQASLLCQLTADVLGRPVVAGPGEATICGNLLVQLMAAGELSSLEEGRALIRTSFPPVHYSPRPSAAWQDALDTFAQQRRATPF